MGERILTREDSKSFIRNNTDKLKIPADFTTIGTGSLAGFSQVKELTISEGTRKIESLAFYTRSFKDTSNLKHINIPASMTEFDIWAFYDCDVLESVCVPEDFSERQALELFFLNPAMEVYFGKKNMLMKPRHKKIQQIMDETKGILTTGETMVLTVNSGIVTIPSDYFGIVGNAFRSMSNKGVKKVIIPSSVRIIAPKAFADLPDLEEIIVLDGATHIDNFAFANCKKLRTVVLPDSVTRVGAGLFMNCPSLRAVKLPAKLTAISEEMFSGCTGLQKIGFGDQIRHVGAGAFAGCTALISLMLPEKVETIGTSAFWECSGLQRLYLPPATKSISPSALCNCQQLNQLYMPRIISDALESKRIFGENTNPVIQWVDEESERPVMEFDEEIETAIPELPVDQEKAAAAESAAIADSLNQAKALNIFASPPSYQKDKETDAAPSNASLQVPSGVSAQGAFQESTVNAAQSNDTVRKLEESIAAMQQQIEMLAKQNAANLAAAAPAAAPQPTLDASIIQSLNDNLTAMRDKFDAVTSMQESVASIAAMSNRVEEIAEMQNSVQQKLEAVGDIRQSADEISGMKEKIEAISDIQEKVDAISEIKEKVEVIPELQQKVEAISESQNNADAISDIRDKVSAISDIQEKVDTMSDMAQNVEAISDIQEKVNVISDVSRKVDAISDIQEKVGAISDVQEKVGAISDIQEKVSAISDVQEKVGEISESQADMNKRFAEMSVRPTETEAAVPSEDLYEFDVRMALAPVQRGHYRSDDRVFTHEISKVIAGPRERSAELKQYTVIASRAFLESEGGERFEIPEGVRRIETQAFWNAPRLLGIELPHSLNEVEPDAFAGCSRLTDIFLSDDFPERRAAEYFLFRPEIKLHWPKKSFFSREKIVTVAELLEKFDDILTAEKVKQIQVKNHILQIPEGFTIIAPDMAKGINVRADEPEHILKTIFLPRSARRIAARAFAELETVMHIVIPNGLQIIDMNAFSGCTGPYRLVLPDTVTYIGPYAFAAPSRYEQIRVPKKIKYISENAFANCEKLASLRFPMSTKYIGGGAVAGCAMLNSLTIPKRFSEELPSIFDGPVKINVRWTEDVTEDYRLEPPASFISIVAPDFPPTPEQRLFTHEMSTQAENFAERLSKLYSHPCIGPLALTEMANQTKFEIPLGVQRICSYAFGNNSRLLTLTIPKALNEFEFGAFFGCERVRDVFFPEDFDHYGAAVLFMRSPLILLTFGNARPIRVRQLLHECPWVFSAGDAAELDAIDGTMKVPNGYVVISSFAYHGMMGMTNLKRFLIPPSAKLVGYHAFVQLKSIEEIVCAEGLQAIEPEAILDCPELKRIVLPSTLRFMGMHPFAGCPKLETVVIPKCFSHRTEELLRDHPQLKIQWCEDFAENECPSIVEEYEEMRSNAQIIDSSIMEECDPLSIPQYRGRDADYSNPIEASADENEQRAIEGEVYEPIEHQEAIPIETTIETVAEEIAEADENPFVHAESEELIDDSISELAEMDGADDAVLEETIEAETDTDVEHVVMTEESLSELAEIDGAEAQEVLDATSEVVSEEASEASEAESVEALTEEADSEAVLDEIAEQEPESTVPTEETAVLEEIADIQQPTVEYADLDDIEETEELTHAKVSEALGKIANTDSVSLDEIVAAISDGDVIYEKPNKEVAPVVSETPVDEVSADEISSTISEFDSVPNEEVAAAESEAVSADFEALAASIFENSVGDFTMKSDESEVSAADVQENEAVAEAAEVIETITDAETIDAETRTTGNDESATEIVEDIVTADVAAEKEDIIESVAETTEEIVESVTAEEPVIESQAEDASETDTQVSDAIEAIAEDIFAPESSDTETEATAEEQTIENDRLADEIVAVEEPAESEISEENSEKIEELADTLFAAEEQPGETADSSEKSTQTIEEEKPVLEIPDVMNTVADSLFVEEEPQEEEPIDPLMKLEEITTAEEGTLKKEMNFLANSLFDDNSIPSLEVIDEPEVEVIKPESDGSDVTLEVMENIADSIFTGDAINEPIEVERTAYEGGVPEDGRLTAKECKRFYHGEFVMEIPEGYREIRAGACAALEHLESLELPSTIEKIGNGAFSDCSALERIVIPESVTEIAEDAFDSCDVLTDVTMPRRFENIAKTLFPNATVFTWLESAPQIIGDGRFTAKLRAKLCDEDTETLEIPEGYLEIRAGACAGLENLKSLTLPSTLEKICAGAFSDCTALETLTIPENVTELNEDAFDGCTKLSHVIVSHDIEEMAKACFPNVMLSFLED